MNDLKILSEICRKLGRKCVEKEEPEESKIAYVKDQDNHIRKLFIDTCNVLNETIPEEIYKLKYIEEISFKDNQLERFPTKLLEIKNLKIINLQNNQLQVLPCKINSLPNLKMLDLSDNHLQTLPREIGQLNKLEHLRLNDNMLAMLPEIDPRCELVSLKFLDLDYAKFKELPEWIFRLKSLEALSLTGMNINRFPLEIKNMKKLNRLYLDSTFFPVWPEKIDFPTSLKFLVLDGAKIKTIPKAIVEKKPLYVRNQRSWQSKYAGIQVSLGNLFDDLDHKLLFSSNNDVAYFYLKEIIKCKEESGKELSRLTDLKLVLLGAGDVGKSTLVQRLCLINPDDDNVLLTSTQTTHGVNTDYSFEIKDITDKEDGKKYNFLLHCWDFGGQDKYSGINRLLLTDKAIYIILLDARSNRYPDLWLEMIHNYAPNSQILLVINKLDENKRANIYFEYYYEKYYPQIYNFCFKISALHPNLGINKISDLIKAIKEIIQNRLNILAPKWKNEWAKVKTEVEKRYLVKNEVILEMRKYREICSQESIKEEKEQDDLINVLNESGTCILFKNNQNIILNPNWIADYLYKLYDADPKTPPILEYSEYLKCADKFGEYRDYARDLLYILVERGLCMTFEQLNGRTLVQKIFFPVFLPEESPSSITKFKQYDSDLKYVFESVITPDLEFQILLTKLFYIIYNYKWEAWQFGIYYEIDNIGILIELIQYRIVFQIWNRKKEMKDYVKHLEKVRNTLLEISEKNFFREYILIEQDNGKTVLNYKTLQVLWNMGLEKYYLALDNEPSRIIEINVKELGEKCGLENKDFGKNNKFLKKEIREMGKVIMKVNKMEVNGDIIEHGGKIVVNGHNNYVNKKIVENNKVDEQKMEDIIKLIQQNCSSVSEETANKILDAIQQIYDEMKKEKPCENIITNGVKLLASVMTVLNGTPVLVDNIGKFLSLIP